MVDLVSLSRSNSFRSRPTWRSASRQYRVVALLGILEQALVGRPLLIGRPQRLMRIFQPKVHEEPFVFVAADEVYRGV